MARFFRGQTGPNRKVHWKNWDDMCTPKFLGGMGFKDLRVFNDALLGMQAWRLVQHAYYLMGRVMKAKYYPKKSFLETSLGCAGSYSWSSIWSAKALVKEGILWRIGNGNRVKIWEDPWVVGEEGRFITSPQVEGINKVSDLINPLTMEWRLDLISLHFHERDQQRILAIPLSSTNDSLTWAYSKDGLYSTKTAYMLGKGGDLGNLHEAWMEIWVMEVSPKVKHFLWRLCSNNLPTRALLKHRHMLDHTTYPSCDAIEETSCHTLLHCQRVAGLWQDSGCSVLMPSVGESWCDTLVECKRGEAKMIQRLDGKKL